ncbi:hypothetical protein NBRC3299_1793 [Acetobacter pasteurianus NBRC 3299]|nr:hypothetical protein NBRC3299_1793 [Acetobacter pasteurianus NBRC 3299]
MASDYEFPKGLLGLLRVTPRYVYDRERGKKVRTSNLYEVMVTAAQRAAAIVAATARKAHEAAKRKAAAVGRAARGLFHDLTATDAENPPKDIFTPRDQVRHEPTMRGRLREGAKSYAKLRTRFP